MCIFDEILKWFYAQRIMYENLFYDVKSFIKLNNQYVK